MTVKCEQIVFQTKKKSSRSKRKLVILPHIIIPQWHSWTPLNREQKKKCVAASAQQQVVPPNLLHCIVKGLDFNK